MKTELATEDGSVFPFASYPGKGRELLPIAKVDNCGHGYGLNHQRITAQTGCACCGRDFTGAYSDWLMIALDHVIPARVCEAMGMPPKWMDSYSNRVWLCSACNGFQNRSTPLATLVCPETEEEFLDMREAVRMQRRGALTKRAAEEYASFNSKRACFGSLGI